MIETPNDSAESAARSQSTPAVAFTLTILALLALLQAVMFLVVDTEASRAAGLALGVCAFLLAFLPRVAGRLRLRMLWFLTAAIIANLGLHVATAVQPVPQPLLQKAALLGYAAVALAIMLTALFRVRIAQALLLSVSIALAVWVGEAALPRFVKVAPADKRVIWVGGTSPHPVLDEYYAPYSQAMTLYPDDPRHYFEQPDPIKAHWQLDVHDAGSAATLEFFGGKPAKLRVRITRAESRKPSHIQLREPGLALTKRATYQLSFRARSDFPLKIGFGVAMGHAPWKNLGLYKEVSVDTDWREFQESFAPASSDANSQIHIDLGSAVTLVELADVTLRHLSDGVVVEPATTSTYSVTYRFNGLGCRGSDYPIPRPANHRRIVVLGDSLTLGVGVHEPDTFAARLERSLNESGRSPSAPTYDVINCGVSGYATREERLFYELYASSYEPDVVVLSMFTNDDRSWREDVRLGYVDVPDSTEVDLSSWRLLQSNPFEGRRPKPDYAPNVGEILQLQEACRRRNARLVVVFFRTHLNEDWNNLIATVSAGLEGKGIPILDLGPEMLREHTPEQLMVHPVIDGHPNEIGHEIAAQQIESFLRSLKLI